MFTVAGAELSKGQVITYLDAHCECTQGWLEPLMHEIYVDRLFNECCLINSNNNNNNFILTLFMVL